jgi:phosphoribosyl 1,2-cyclic phosphodiesterase
MKTVAIASGSNGNSYFLEQGGDSVLVDVGISCKELLFRMQNLGLKINNVGGIFLSHEHSDHIRGLEVLTKKYEIPIYLTEGTFNAKNFKLNDRLVNYIKSDKKIGVGNIIVNPFSKFHDAVEPCSFMLNAGKLNISVITDIGKVCPNVIKNIKNSDVCYIESNYDELMLNEGRYPFFLKKRITSDYGHISNYQSAMAIMEHATKRLKCVFLSHLSGNNNKPELALNTFNSLIKLRNDSNFSVNVASREKESNIFNLN